MSRHLLASLLSAAVLASTASAFAQNNAPANPSPMTTGSSSNTSSPNSSSNNNATPAPIPGGNINSAPAKDANSAGIVVKMNGVTSANGQTQIEGRLVDVDSLANGDILPPTGPEATGTGGSAAAAGLAPNNLQHNTGTGAINGKGAGMSGSTGTLVPLHPDDTNANNGTSVGVAPGNTNSSFGTYNHPGATAGVGTSALQSGVVGQGISPNKPIAVRQGMTPADDATGTGTASVAAGGSGQPNTLAPGNTHNAPHVATDASIRQHLANGVRAAILANGHAYTLDCDPKQLAQYAGQTVRASGTLAANNTLSPTSLETQSTTGSFQPISLAPAKSPNKTASER
ncbi:MAG TPA: hypothetical protein VH253_09680 [Phycisphaerae bacterium]|nr:hypothetical protein [Phycisphaerae bacterium]